MAVVNLERYVAWRGMQTRANLRWFVAFYLPFLLAYYASLSKRRDDDVAFHRSLAVSLAVSYASKLPSLILSESRPAAYARYHLPLLTAVGRRQARTPPGLASAHWFVKSSQPMRNIHVLFNLNPGF